MEVPSLNNHRCSLRIGIGTCSALIEPMNPGKQLPWVVLDERTTSVGVRAWTLQQGAVLANVFELPHGDGVHVLFTGGTPLRDATHAGWCFTTACARAADRIDSGGRLDVTPVSVSAGALEIRGADALAVVASYFGNALASLGAMDEGGGHAG